MNEAAKDKGGNQPVCIQSGDIAALAREGIERALASRRAAVELTAEQVDGVSGGLVAKPWIIAGGFPVDPFGSKGLGGVATLPAVQARLI